MGTALDAKLARSLARGVALTLVVRTFVALLLVVSGVRLLPCNCSASGLPAHRAGTTADRHSKGRPGTWLSDGNRWI
jgi:hypothetical protein